MFESIYYKNIILLFRKTFNHNASSYYIFGTIDYNSTKMASNPSVRGFTTINYYNNTSYNSANDNNNNAYLFEFSTLGIRFTCLDVFKSTMGIHHTSNYSWNNDESRSEFWSISCTGTNIRSDTLLRG